MSTMLITQPWNPNGTPTNVTSMTVTITRVDTGAVVISAASMTNTALGVYEYLFTTATPGITYSIAITVIWNTITYPLPAFTDTLATNSLVTSDEVSAELGLSNLTPAQQTVINNAIIRVQGAIKQYLQFDPVQKVHTEYHPLAPFQSQISRGIWEVMEQRAVLRQVAEAATNELQLQHTPIRDIPLNSSNAIFSGSGTFGSVGTINLVNSFTNVWINGIPPDVNSRTITVSFTYNGTQYSFNTRLTGAAPTTISFYPGSVYWQGSATQIPQSGTACTVTSNGPSIVVFVDYDGRSGTRPGSFPTDSLKLEGYDYWPNFEAFDDAGYRICNDGVLRTIGLWPTNPNTVQITYMSGYSYGELRGESSTIDASPIWDVALVESVRRARRVFVEMAGVLGVRAGVIQSEGIGEYNYSMSGAAITRLLSGPLLPESRVSLQPFVNWGVQLGS